MYNVHTPLKRRSICHVRGTTLGPRITFLKIFWKYNLHNLESKHVCPLDTCQSKMTQLDFDTICQ